MVFGRRELVMSVVVLAVPVASYFLVFKPQNARIEAAKTEVSHKMSLLAQLEAEAERTEDLMAENAEIASRIETIEARLPSDKEVDEVIRQVSNLCVQAGLAQPALASEDPVRAATYMEQPLTLKTTGDFRGYYEFLLMLEQLPRVTRISDLEVKAPRNAREGDDGIVDIEFTLSIYFQAEGDAA
ncbi:MAG: type 4a pilus biogenesis protein PilO [Planctomycetota bacterium]